MIAEGSAEKMAASARTIETELAELKRKGIINRKKIVIFGAFVRK